MIFKERTFHGETPPDEEIETPGQDSDAVTEAKAADFLAMQPDFDATGISLTVSNGRFVLSGFVASGLEGQKAEAALRERFSSMPVENRLRIG